MRFVSHIRNFAVGIVTHQEAPTAFGTVIVMREGFTAHFKQDVTDRDVEFAERVFERGGMVYGRTTEIDEVTMSPLISRLSVFDTDEEAAREGWEGQTLTDDRGVEHDKKEYIERVLSERAVNHQDFRQIEEEPVPMPWPNYLQFEGSLEQLLQKVVDDGYEIGAVLAYERQQGKRPAVIEALERLLLAQDADVEETVPA